ncbi:MAG: F0F1 ATP synthase subunit delta, partial [Candidatus Moranbacteria bacterium]|nr:F0F1 ATP synthase subunit delta [Candidatus Moranbacteria bacterium]
TAHQADVATQQTLVVWAEKVFAAEKVAASFVTDANLIGGVRMQSKETLYDASFATALRKLETNLTK